MAATTAVMPSPSSSLSSAPTVISTFSGCGGSSLGYKMAGYDVRLACEWDDHAVETYRANFPATPVYHGDVSELMADEAMELAGIGGPGGLDLFDGSPPCQGFSTAGKRATGDGRNQLFRQYVRLLRGLKPRAFVMENVSGMTTGRMRPIFDECLALLRDSGYQVKARVINAQWYGVPQSRSRVIFIGARDDLGITPTHPTPTVTKSITASEALEGAPEGDDTPTLSEAWRKQWNRLRPGDRMSDVLTRTIGVAASWGTAKLHPHRPSRTLCKQQGGKGYATMLHWAAPRAISIPEAMRLASFPDDFVFPGKYQERWSRIGNSVPPLFMKAIAEHVRVTILEVNE